MRLCWICRTPCCLRGRCAESCSLFLDGLCRVLPDFQVHQRTQGVFEGLCQSPAQHHRLSCSCLITQSKRSDKLQLQLQLQCSLTSMHVSQSLTCICTSMTTERLQCSLSLQ